MKTVLIVLIFTLLLQNCSTKTKKVFPIQNAQFISFGISYRSGFEGNFDVIIDTNKIFFSNQGYGIQYGILPDSIYILIDSAVITTLNNINKVSKKTDCQDCPMIGITCITNSDTIKIHQQGREIENVFRKLFSPMYNLIRQKNNSVPINEMFFKTRRLYKNLPPPFPG